MRWRKVAVWSILVILVLVVGLTILFFTSPAQQFILRSAEKIAARAGVPFNAEGLQLKPLDMTVSFSKFDYDKDGVTIHATNLHIELPWNAYAANGITINTLTADEMNVRFVSPPSAEPAPGTLSALESFKLPLIRIGHLGLKSGSFIYESGSTRVEIPAFSTDLVNGAGKIFPTAPVSIAPNTQFQVSEIPIELSPDGLRYGPVNWSVSGDQKASGTVSGTFRWTPTVAGSASLATDPFDVDTWNGIVLRGQVEYANGVLTVPEFAATRGAGELTGSAKISDALKSAAVRWSDVQLDPSGVEGITSGELDLQWQATDFADAEGRGRVSLRTEKYGTAQSDIAIAGGRAQLAIEAASMGAVIHADINTGLDRQLSGTFKATHQEYGAVSAEGTLGGTLTSPEAAASVTASDIVFHGVGPMRATARATYRDMILMVTDTEAHLDNSQILDGNLRIDLNTRALEGSVPIIALQLRDFMPDGSGQIQAMASLSGTLDDPIAALHGASPGLDIGGTHIDTLAADAELQGNVLQVTQLRAAQGQGVLEASGSANLATEQVAAKARVANLRITQIRGVSGIVNLTADVAGSYQLPMADVRGELTDLSYEGEEHGTVAFAGTVNRNQASGRLQSSKYNASVDGSVALMAPYAFNVDAALNRSALHYQQYDATVTGRVMGEGTLDPVSVVQLQLQEVKLTGEGVDLTASGALDTGIQMQATADLAKLPLEDLRLTGQAQVSAVVKGPLDSPTVDGALRTTDATIRTNDMSEPARIEAAVEFTKDRFEIRAMRADYADAQITINGSGSLKGAGEFTFTAANIRPERFFPDRPLAGVIGLEGALTATAPRLNAIAGRATVTQLDLTAGGIQFNQTQPGEIALADNTLAIRNFALTGAETAVSVKGSVNLESGSLNLDLQANTDLRILEGFIPRSNASGFIESEIAIRGAYSEPDMNGFVRLTQAQIQLAEPSLLVSEFTASVELKGAGFRIQQATGDLNGGMFDITGAGELSSAGLSNASIRATFKGTQLEYPEGLQSEIAANLLLAGSGTNLTLTGNVEVLDALYRQDVDLREEVFRRLTPAERMRAQAQTGGLAQQINLFLNVETTGPVAVSNNVAKLDLIGTFRVRGTVADPIVLGRASALEGGEVYFGPSEGAEAKLLGERRDRYIVERGTIDFNNALRTEPQIDFEATHELQVKGERYLIRMRASGTPTDLRTEMTSDPYLSEPDIIAMLLTGRSFTDLQSAHLAVAREQLLNYLSGQLTSRFFRNAGAALGLDTVTIEPVTLAGEEDLSARLTIGKDLTRDLSLIYSQNLAGARDQAWIVNYSTFKGFMLRGINRTDQDQLRFELRHGLEFGGGPTLPRRIAPREEDQLHSVTFNGSTLAQEKLRGRVGKIGAPYNVYRMNDDVRSLRAFLSSEGYPSSRVRARRVSGAGMADVTFTITQGPKIHFEYRGAKVPANVQKEIVQVWETGFAEASSLRGSIDVLLRYFRDEGYLQAGVAARNEAQNKDERLYVFEITPAMKFAKPIWLFHGIEHLDVTTSAGTIMANPMAIQEEIEFDLRGNGFLDATSTVPSLELGNGAAPRFAVTVEQGGRYMVSTVRYSGNAFFTNARLSRVVLLGPTEVISPDAAGAARPPEAEEPLKPFPYTADWVGTARKRLLTEYWQEGFNNVQIGSSTDYAPGSGKIEVRFEIREGERQKISDIQILGDSKVLPEHLRRYFQFKEGDPVDYMRINLTRKKLYDTGLFKRVDIEVAEELKKYAANVMLNDRAQWELRYGVTVTDHQDQGARDLGFSTEITRRNLLGKGITAGTSLKNDSSLREGRFFTSFPVFMGKDVTSTSALFRTRETLADSVSNTWGATLQQQWRLSDFYLLSYDYSFRRIATFERDLTDDDPEIKNEVLRVARFSATLSRDTRDNILNATRGVFLSSSLQVAPPGIGSSVTYVRNYSQFLRFRKIWRPDVIWASGYRLGLARSFGEQPLVQTDQFNAVESLRAFGKDSLALKPGNALLVMNQELRFPLFWRIGMAGFLDIGNGYDRVGVAHVLQQRYSPGLGLRIDTPFTLLRVDWGFNPFPKPGENRQTISFGIGQAF